MPVGGPAFSSVRKAREALRERAHELLTEYINICKMAAASGDYETAQKGFAYLLAHIPKDEDGLSILEIDVDKPKVIEGGPKGPTIQIGPIGIQVLEPKQLTEPEAIEVTWKSDVTTE